MRILDAQLADLNSRFASAEPLDLLRFVHAVFGRRCAILTSMQRAGTTLCYLADRAQLDFDVLFVDTGVLHRETLATRDELAMTHRNLRVITLQSERSFMQQTAEEGVLYLTREGQERCCDLRKSAPLQSVKGKYDAFIGALRRGEGGARANVKPFALDPEMNAFRIHPFANVSSEDLENMAARVPDLVVNPLHAMGFSTIGCFPCTTPVRPDEPDRAGRWRHLAGVEYCGINPIDRGAAGSIEVADRYREPLGLSE
ncbi:MAG: phosphoadenosine phosphosulfate reductase family protein [Polyangiaceae bacterium]|nr:phosphoadenosine phosphosulfate reductase family protein [Polyangiaceae bacterium]